MDDLVLRGMAKWPNVPAVYGWLVLDRRGGWRIKGDAVSSPAVTAFINRNYGHDEEGQWFFQNGPQRVYVALDYTPFVYRIVGAGDAPPALATHSGVRVVSIAHAWMDEHGALLLETEHGVGLLHDRDLAQVFPHLIDANGNALAEDVLEHLFELLQSGRAAPLWLRFGDDSIRIKPVRAADVPRRFRYVRQPRAPEGAQACS